jgi:hypothetical protein
MFTNSGSVVWRIKRILREGLREGVWLPPGLLHEGFEFFDELWVFWRDVYGFSEIGFQVEELDHQRFGGDRLLFGGGFVGRIRLVGGSDGSGVEVQELPRPLENGALAPFLGAIDVTA